MTGSKFKTGDWVFRWTEEKGFESAFFPSMGCEGDFYKVLQTCQECPYILEHLALVEYV